MDILRSVMPEACLSVNTLQALALDCLYTGTLSLSCHTLHHNGIVLYDRKHTFIVAVCKPFYKMLTRRQTSWDVRPSVIDSLATFFLLSHVKIMSVYKC